MVAFCPRSHAQARTEARASASATGCTLIRSANLQLNAASIASTGGTIAAVATATGWLLAYRARTDAVWIARLDDSLVRVDEDRQVSGPVAAFAMVPAPGGAVLVLAERDRHDVASSDVLLARVDTRGDARNVPRQLGRVSGCDGVAVTPSIHGFVVAWGSREGPTTSTVTTDLRGVATARSRVVVDASMPVLTALTGQTRFAMIARGAAGSTLLHLDESAAAIEAWPLQGRGRTLVALPSQVLAWSSSGDDGTLATRWWPGAAPIELSNASLRAITPSMLAVTSVADRYGVLAMIQDSTGRELLVRVGNDGVASSLGLRGSGSGALAASLDNTAVLVVNHRADGALAVQHEQCPRMPTLAPISGPAVSPAAISSGALGDAGRPESTSELRETE